MDIFTLSDNVNISWGYHKPHPRVHVMCNMKLMMSTTTNTAWFSGIPQWIRLNISRIHAHLHIWRDKSVENRWPWCSCKLPAAILLDQNQRSRSRRKHPSWAWYLLHVKATAASVIFGISVCPPKKGFLFSNIRTFYGENRWENGDHRILTMGF